MSSCCACRCGSIPVEHDVDVLEHERSVYRGHFKSAVYGALESGFRDGRQVVIVGSSNALLGFQTDEVEALMPDAQVHNLSTPSIRADEIRELVELVWNIMPEEQRRRTTIVVIRSRSRAFRVRSRSMASERSASRRRSGSRACSASSMGASFRAGPDFP